MKKLLVFIGICTMASCSNKSEVAKSIQGKIERDEIAVVGN